jgi:hypothetical protein
MRYDPPDGQTEDFTDEKVGLRYYISKFVVAGTNLLTHTALVLFNGLFRLTIWTKPFISFRDVFKVTINLIVNSADHDQTSRMCCALVTLVESVATSRLNFIKV